MNEENGFEKSEQTTIPDPDTSASYDAADDDTDEEEQMIAAAALEDTKHRAKQLGITFHPSIGIEKLRAKIQAALDDAPDDESNEPSAVVTSKSSEMKRRAKEEMLRLIRVRITCMDPMKKAYDGDFFMTGNAVIGTVKRYVPFGVEWHVPKIILNMIREKQFNQHSTVKNARNMETTVSRLVPMYAVQELEPLSRSELDKLAQRQAMAAGQASE